MRTFAVSVVVRTLALNACTASDTFGGPPGANRPDTAKVPLPGIAAPWLGWGPDLWANGTAPRSDGPTWVQSDFESDNTRQNADALQKVGAMLRKFVTGAPHGSRWFLSGRAC